MKLNFVFTDRFQSAANPIHGCRQDRDHASRLGNSRLEEIGGHKRDQRGLSFLASQRIEVSRNSSLTRSSVIEHRRSGWTVLLSILLSY